jgi:hypothetical protein
MAGKEPSTQSLSPQAFVLTERVPRAALYGRVSTTAGQDPQMQLRELR